MLGSPFLTPGKPGEVQELEQEKQDALEGFGQTSDNALAMAVLEQSKALTSLVAQISSASQDPMADLLHGSSGSTRGSIGRARLQAELAAQRGAFFAGVLQQISRRMSPTSSPDVSPQVMLDRGISGVKYLERFGGFARQRELGQLQFQIMGILDNLMAENIEAVKDGVALLAVTVDQACMDSGRMDLATLLCLQEDAPSSIYVNRQPSPQLNVKSKKLHPTSQSKMGHGSIGLSERDRCHQCEAQRDVGVETIRGGIFRRPSPKGKAKAGAKEEVASKARRRSCRGGGVKKACVLGLQHQETEAGQESNPLEASIDFCTWALCIPRWVLRTKTEFSWHLWKSFSVRWCNATATPTTTFPLPVPRPGCFSGGGPGLPRRQLWRIAKMRLLHVIIYVLN